MADKRPIPPNVAQVILFSCGAIAHTRDGRQDRAVRAMEAAVRHLDSLSEQDRVAFGRFIAAMARATQLGVEDAADFLDEICDHV
jgi:hypothetical protein